MSQVQPAQQVADNGSLLGTPDFSTAEQHMAGCKAICAAPQRQHLTFPSLDSTASSSVVIWFPDSSTTSRAGSLVSTSGMRVRLLYLRRTTRSCWSSPMSAGRSDSLLLQQRGARGVRHAAAHQSSATCKRHVAGFGSNAALFVLHTWRAPTPRFLHYVSWLVPQILKAAL